MLPPSDHPLPQFSLIPPRHSLQRFFDRVGVCGYSRSWSVSELHSDNPSQMQESPQKKPSQDEESNSKQDSSQELKQSQHLLGTQLFELDQPLSLKLDPITWS